MTRAEILAHNAGVEAVAAIAAASADLLRARLVEKPTRYAFAVAALDGIVEAASELIIQLPPDGLNSTAGEVAQRSPAPVADGAVVAEPATC